MNRLRLYARLVRLDKPIGIWLLFWPTLWALLVAAHGEPPLDLLAVFAAGTILMRSAGCAINDWADRDFDRHVARTKDRPLTSGAISGREALAVFAVLLAASAALLAFLNDIARLLALVAALLAAVYPFTKRFLPVPQAVLGLAFGMGVPMAFAAVRGDVPASAWLIFAANFFWTLGYDTEYAMVDREDDLRIGIRTSAITFGRADVAAVGACYAVALALLGALGAIEELGAAYWAGVAVAGAIAVRHMGWIRHRDRDACFRAFRDNTWFGAAVAAGLFLDYWL